MELYQRLEERLADWAGVPREGMVVCSSGTAALHLAFEAGPSTLRHQVLMSDFTMVACPRAAVLAQMKPVFFDCREDGLVDVGLIDEHLETDTLARDKWYVGLCGDPKDQEVIEDTFPYGVLLVDLYGRRSEAPAKPRRNSLYVVEDMAELHGVPPSPRSDAACWSLYRNKVLAGEEGGAVWFREPERAKVARELRCLGFTEAHDYSHRPRGHNYRMSNTHAGLILDCLPKFQERACERRRAEILYDRIFPAEWRMPPREKVWVYDLRIRGMTSETQGVVVSALRAAEIPARHGFKTMSSQEEFRGCKVVKRLEGESFTSVLSREVIYLPAEGVTEEKARRCLEVISKCLGK